MSDPANPPVVDPTPGLRADLAACEGTLNTTAPALRHFLSADESFLLSEEVIARVRGMLSDVERQLLHALDQAADGEKADSFERQLTGALLSSLADEPGLVRHLHSLAIETYVGELFRVRNGVDPVLAPTLQDLLSSEDQQVSASAMALLAAQARFVQAQRRMELPLQELPAELHEQALGVLSKHQIAGHGAVTDNAVSLLRGEYDEDRGRLALLSNLITSLDGATPEILSVEQAGISLFASALASGSGQTRETVLLSTDASQSARLSMMLRIAGLSSQAVATQVLTLHPAKALPEWLPHLSVEQASLLLASTMPAGME